MDANDGVKGKRFGKDSQIEALYEYRLPTNRLALKVICHKCKLDPELYGDGIFSSSIHDLKKNKMPCGCSSHARHTKSQWETTLKRECVTRQVEFLGFVGEGENVKSYIKLKCKIHGNTWSTTTADSLLHNNTGCPECKLVTIGLKKRKDDALIVSSFMASGKFQEGTQFWRGQSKSKKDGTYQKWKYLCPVCSKDEYALAGVCSGIFESHAGSLQRGCLPCRCHGNEILTEVQREYKLKKHLSSEFKFVKWLPQKINASHSLRILCQKHGEYTTTIHTAHDSVGFGCPICASNGFSRARTGFVYVLKVCGESGCFTGYGISNIVRKRLKTHSRNLKKLGLYIETCEIFEMSGHKAFEIESLIMTDFPIVRQEIDGFKKEATHSYLYSEVVSFVKSMSGVIPIDIPQIVTKNPIDLPLKWTIL